MKIRQVDETHFLPFASLSLWYVGFFILFRLRRRHLLLHTLFSRSLLINRVFMVTFQNICFSIPKLILNRTKCVLLPFSFWKFEHAHIYLSRERERERKGIDPLHQAFDTKRNLLYKVDCSHSKHTNLTEFQYTQYMITSQRIVPVTSAIVPVRFAFNLQRNYTCIV